MRWISGKTATMLTVAMALALVAALACGAADEDDVATAVPGAAVAPVADTAVPATPIIAEPTTAAVTDIAVVQPTKAAVVTAVEAPMEEAEAGFKYVATPQVPGIYWDYLYTGPTPTKFQENPKFAALVAQGKLPPVEQRLPEEFKVSQPPEGIGDYGGIYRNTGTWWIFPYVNASLLYKNNADEVTKIPHVMFWEISDDGRVYTMRLRKGMKWSDGKDLDMEDVRFAWEDVNFNTTLNARLASQWYDDVTGNAVKFGVVDDLHWTLSFDTPAFNLMEDETPGQEHCKSFCWWGATQYLKPFHEDYASGADITKLIEDRGVQTWKQAWGLLNDYRKNNEIPNTTPFIQETWNDQVRTWRSSPYYFVVDPEGNQLPYVDGAMTVITESREVTVFRGMAGETDLLSQGFLIPEIPLYRANADKGDYSILNWVSSGGGDYTTVVCQTCNTDPEIGKWLRTSDFRNALSLGMDRQAVQDSVLLGLGILKNWVVHPSIAYYPGDEWAFHNTKYDPAAANALLDGIGLTAKDADGFRLRSDGSGERLSFAHISDIGPAGDILELQTEYYADIGIEIKNRPMSGPHTLGYPGKEYLFMLQAMGTYQGNPWYAGWSRCCSVGGGPPFTPDISDLDRSMKIGPAGATITEGGYTPRCDCPISDIWLPTAPANTYPADPTGKILRLVELFKEGKKFTQWSPERIEMGKELYRIHAEEKFHLNVVAHAGAGRGIVINRNNFLNGPDTHTTSVVGFHSELYYFIDGKDNLSD